MQFPRGISLKVNLIVRLEFEHAYYDLSVQLFSHYPTVNLHHHWLCPFDADKQEAGIC